MAKLEISLANKLIPNRLKLNCNGLEVDFDNCSFTHNSVILKIGNKITGRIFWINNKQSFKFKDEISKFDIEHKAFDIIVKSQKIDKKDNLTTDIAAIRTQYEAVGVENYYKENANSYKNPHEKSIKNILENFLFERDIDKNIRILDLCCGGGEISKILLNNGFKNISGLDPFTHELYKKQTGLECDIYDFKDLATGKFKKEFDLIICSFALHLAPESMLPNILYNLNTSNLIIISPNKKPQINSIFNLNITLGQGQNNTIYLKYYTKDKDMK